MTTTTQRDELELALALANSIFNPLYEAYLAETEAWYEANPQHDGNIWATWQDDTSPKYSNEYKAARMLTEIARKALADYISKPVQQISDPVY